MSPTKKYRTLFGTAVSLMCAASLWNCSDQTSSEKINAVEGVSTNVALALNYAETPLLDSLVLDCYGTDTLHFVHSTDNGKFNMDLFPGDHWNFKAKIYANGALMQVGELETKLTAGTSVNLNIQMHAIVGYVYIEVPLGLNNDAGVKSGIMKLTSDKDSYSIPMEQTASSGVFKSDMLKLGANYDVEIILYDALGKEIYKLTDQFLLTEDSPVPDLTLNSLRTQVALAVNAASNKNVSLSLPLPAGYRKPRIDDLLITEVFPAPDSKDSSQFEFVEIYNGSLDTLILDDCTIGLTSSSTLKTFPLTVSEILPNQALVLGSTISEKTPALFINTDGWADMTGTKGAVVFKCDGITLDTLFYAGEPDSLHTNVVPALGSSKYGSSAQLKLDQWKNRADSTAWTLAPPTPGEI